MYSAHIEHVMRHLHRMQAEVQSMIEDAPHTSRMFSDGLTFVYALHDLRKATLAFYRLANGLDISGADWARENAIADKLGVE